MYQLTSVFLKVADAAVFNMSLLTSDVWAVVASYAIFQARVSYLYFIAFAIIAGGLVLYNCQAPPGITAVAERQGDADDDAARKEEEGTGNTEATKGERESGVAAGDTCGSRASAFFAPARRSFASLLSPPERNSLAARLSGVAGRLLRDPECTRSSRPGKRYHSHSPALQPLPFDEEGDVRETEIVVDLEDGNEEEEGTKLLS